MPLLYRNVTLVMLSDKASRNLLNDLIMTLSKDSRNELNSTSFLPSGAIVPEIKRKSFTSEEKKKLVRFMLTFPSTSASHVINTLNGCESITSKMICK